MMRWEIINAILQRMKDPSYLEIGVRDWICFDEIKAARKVSVDPAANTKPAEYPVTSDQFFKEYKGDHFDLIFIDGLHVDEQVERDIRNSLRVLRDGGVIVVHDCLPVTEHNQRPYNPENQGGFWYGTPWKAVARLRQQTKELRIKTVDTDCGCAIITRGEPVPVNPYKIEWSVYDKFKGDMMGVISIDEFNEGLK